MAEAGWGREAGPEGGAIPLYSVLYKEEGCERSGLASRSLQCTRGRGTKMLRRGGATPGSWGSFWAILALVGLAARAGEWAGGGAGWGAGRRGRTSGPSCTVAGGGGVQPTRRSRESIPSGGRPACLRGEEGLADGRGPDTRRPFHCPLSQAAGPARGPWDAISIQVLQSDSLGGGAGKRTHSPVTLPFSLSLPFLTHSLV